MICSRRDFARFAIAAPATVALYAKIDSKIGGVMIGAQTYSFRDRPLDQCIAAMKDIGLGYAELWQGHLEPPKNDEKKAWRENPPMDQIRSAKQMFQDAGIEIYALNYSFRDNFTDPEIESGFRIAE